MVGGDRATGHHQYGLWSPLAQVEHLVGGDAATLQVGNALQVAQWGHQVCSIQDHVPQTTE